MSWEEKAYVSLGNDGGGLSWEKTGALELE